MKKYIQYNAAQYQKQATDLGGRSGGGVAQVTKNDCHSGVLDLSGKPGQGPVTMVTRPKWEANREQDTALDLSKGTHLENSDQHEALDLSKPSTNRGPQVQSPHSNVKSPGNPAQHHGIQSPPSTCQSKAGIGQYSLLQAALNSTPPSSSMAQGFEKMAQLEAELRARMIAGGLLPADASRAIKPFSSMASRPLGISVPHLSMPNLSIAVVQGIHKPVAITTPQLNQSLVSSKSVSVNQGTVGSVSQSVNSSTSLSTSLSQSELISSYHRHNQSDSPKGMMSFPGGFAKRGDNKQDQFVIRTADSTSHIINGPHYMKMENLHGYACAQCPKIFKNKAALKLHTTVHKTSEERQYECQVCKRRFLHRHHLVVHQRKHSGEKPFKCDACSKTFMAIFLLHKHLRKHIRENSQNSVISTEQLQQLHVRKMTSDGPVGSKEIVGNVTNPVIINGSPITVPDGQSDSDVKKKTLEFESKAEASVTKQSVVDVKTEEEEVITLWSDDLNSSTSTLSVSNSSVLSNLKDTPKGALNELKIPVDVGNETPEVKKEDKSDSHTVSTVETPKEISVILVESDTNHHDKVSDTNNIKNSLKTGDQEVTENIDKEENCMENLDKTEPKQKENLNPFPEFASDDEVMLDFETGELKVVGRNEIDTVQDSKVSKPEIISDKENETNQDNCDSEKEIKDISEQNDEKLAEKLGSDCELALDNKGIEECREKHYGLNLDGTEVIDNTMSDVEQDGIRNEDIIESTDNEISIPDNLIETVHCRDDTIQEKYSKNEIKAETERKRKSEQDEEQEPEAKRKSLEITQEETTGDTSTNDIVILESDSTKLDLNRGKPMVKVKQKCSKKSRRAKCELCLRTFHSNHHLLLHMAVHKKNPMLISLKKAKANQMKVLGYNGKASVNCSICKKVFKFQKSLNSHMRVHSEKLKQNKLISKAFRDFMSEAVPTTQKSHTSPTETESQLTIVSTEAETVEHEPVNSKMTSSNENAVNNTMSVVRKFEEDNDPPIEVIIGTDQIKRFVCHACNNTYTTKQKLKMHALIHKDNCFLCDICGKSFFREVTLEKHIATHLLPRPYICVICKKSFIHRSSLMRHKVVHERPSMPSLKQQVADVNFELKMLDTYTMLREERMQKIQYEKVIELHIEPENVESKLSVLDLSVRVKMDDSSLPPVLSPAISQSNTPAQSTSDLSPPIITNESMSVKPVQQFDSNKFIKQEVCVNNEFDNEIDKDKIKQCEKRKRSISYELHGPINSEASTFQKVARKTRVYETSCRVCREKFPNVMSLKTHMTVHNTVETHLYECHVCHHRFTQSCSLLRHLKTSCQEKRMTCMPCGKTFHRRNTFDQHMKLHQVGPPSLDGSFYDKRKDEAEVKEEVERESDIENNNTKSAELKIDIPIKTEPPPAQPVMTFIPSKLNTNEDTSDSTDSDARTYLYSEGEIHIAPMSDFSDSDFSPPQSPKPEISRSSLPNNSSPNTMTLNLLSAVCSDIRNAEKEEEQRKREIEERQKELETIEILANLKRGAMQSSSENSKKIKPKLPVRPSATQGTSENQSQVIDLSKEKNENSECKQVLNSPKLEGIKHEPTKLETPNSIKPARSSKVAQNFPTEVDKKIAASVSEVIPKIPTVVLEVAAEAERIRREKMNRIKQNQAIQFQPGKGNIPVVDERTQAILQELSRLNVHNSIIQERLSLLMKAQPSTHSKTSLSTEPSLVSMTTSPKLANSSSSKICPSSVQKFKTEPQTDPQDLSVKKSLSEFEGTDLNTMFVPRGRDKSEKSVVPPPLVPMFHCELCGKVIYNQNELLSHMRDHNISPESFRKKPPFVAIGDPRRSVHKVKRSRSSDLPSSTASSPLSDKTANDYLKVTTSVKKVTPPLSLDLSLKASPSKNKTSPAMALPNLPSPQTGSDTCMSDAVSSPTTPSGNLDNLRAELRNKIYARRRSQGLEELTVEFKSPEPSEMTEEEKKKLDHRRECNRQAAQRSRMRKKDLVDTLLEELHKEEIVNSDLRRKMEYLTAEKTSLLKAFDSHTCVNDNVGHTDKG